MEKYISVKDLEEAALKRLPKSVRDYYSSGATEEQTLGENKNAFQRFVYCYYIIASSSIESRLKE